MNPDPKLRDPIFLFLIAALLGAIAHEGVTINPWLRLFIALAVIPFGLSGLVSFINWNRFQNARRVREMNRAKVAMEVAYSDALRGLTPRQTEIVAEHNAIEILVTAGNDGAVFNINPLVGDKIDLDFMEVFLKQSLETKREDRAPFGYLWPAREHHVFVDWKNSEKLCRDATEYILLNPRNWANKSAGPYSAKLNVPPELIATYFRLEIG